MASTASAMVPWPEIMMTGASTSLARSHADQVDAAAVRQTHVDQVRVGALRVGLALGDARTQYATA